MAAVAYGDMPPQTGGKGFLLEIRCRKLAGRDFFWRFAAASWREGISSGDSLPQAGGKGFPPEIRCRKLAGRDFPLEICCRSHAAG